MHWFFVDLQGHTHGPQMQDVLAVPVRRANLPAQQVQCAFLYNDEFPFHW